MELAYTFTLIGANEEVSITLYPFSDHDSVLEEINAILEEADGSEPFECLEELEEFFDSSCVEFGDHNLHNMLGSFEECFDLLQTFEEVGEALVPAYMVYCLEELSEFISASRFQELYQGHYRNGAEFARELCEDCYDLKGIPDFISIDWEDTWDNLQYDYTEIDAPDGGVFIFRND